MFGNGQDGELAVILSLLRIVGSICTLAQLSFNSSNHPMSATVLCATSVPSPSLDAEFHADKISYIL
jgi:hypothetical protein